MSAQPAAKTPLPEAKPADQSAGPAAYWTKPRRLFALWAVIIAAGFVATQYYQYSRINWIWLGLTVIGLGYMLKVMPLKNPMLRRIFLVWLVVLAAGLIISFLAFQVPSLAVLVGNLGVFWLAVMGLGHVGTGLVSSPSRLFYINGAVLIAAALISYNVPVLLQYQYIVAAVVGGGTMAALIIF